MILLSNKIDNKYCNTHNNNIGDEGAKALTKNWQGLSLYLNNTENVEVRKRYEESVKLLLGKYVCKDITTYVICKFLNKI